jgi:hypothetical protein
MLNNGHMLPAENLYGGYSNLVYIESGTPDAAVGVDWLPSNSALNAAVPMGGLLFRLTDANNYFPAGEYGQGSRFTRSSTAPIPGWRIHPIQR